MSESSTIQETVWVTNPTTTTVPNSISPHASKVTWKFLPPLKPRELDPSAPGESGQLVVPSKSPCVYYLYAGGTPKSTLLYIGQTSNLVGRLADHERSRSWWPEVRLVRWVTYRTQAFAVAAEKREIQNLGPLYNATYNY